MTQNPAQHVTHGAAPDPAGGIGHGAPTDPARRVGRGEAGPEVATHRATRSGARAAKSGATRGPTGGPTGGVGWFRRNRWGLIGLVPAVLALLALSAENVYYGVWSMNPRTPVAADSGGRYTLGTTRIRLVGVAAATDLKSFDGTSFVPPPHVTIWRARIEFATEVKDGNTDIGGCAIAIEDTAGRTFSEDPKEIDGAADVVASSCLPPDNASGPTTYVNAVYFALPSDAHPVAVRITEPVQLPRYVRLPAT